MKFMKQQKTIQRAIVFSGIGLHTGKRVRMELIPAEANSGVRFVRTDIDAVNSIQASIHNVTSTTRATSLGNDQVRVTTVEHLLSALYVLGIDNLTCAINAEEVPVLDGSCLPFMRALKKAGIKKLDAHKRILKVQKLIEVRDGDKLARIKPAREFKLNYGICFEHPAIGTQNFVYTEKTDFEKEVSPSRTFGFLSDVERMQAMGLALGGSLENTVVLDDTGILNEGGLRFKDEFVRHKVLDALGDLSLCGYRVLGEVELYKAGHEMQTRLVRELLKDKSAYTIASPASLEEDEDGVFVGESAYA